MFRTLRKSNIHSLHINSGSRDRVPVHRQAWGC